MIFGADKQNKNLKDAAAKTKDTSARTQTSNAYAARIASDKGNKSAGNAANSKNTVYKSKKNLKTSDTIKYSKEGLMDGKSTYLQMNNSGYMNQRLQQARYTKNFESHKSPFMQRNFTNIQHFNKTIHKQKLYNTFTTLLKHFCNTLQHFAQLCTTLHSLHTF